MKLTKWFKPNQKPVHTGVYQRDYGHGLFYCYWTGKHWHIGQVKLTDACKSIYSSEQELPWRGLTK